MFKMFKKPTEQHSVIAQSLPEEPKSTKYPSIVDEIHNEFYSAGESLLLEANNLLKELEQKDLAKGERLAAAGFNKTREAVSSAQTKIKLATTKEVAEFVMYYKHNYPNNKFITEDQVKAICEKYGLIFGETSMYKGFVPENKLSLIESFKLKAQDKASIWFQITVSNNGKNAKLPTNYLTDKDLTDRGLRYFAGLGSLDYCYITASNGLGDTSLFKKEVAEMFNGLLYVKAEKCDIGLKICAPAKDMEIPKGKMLDGYKIKDIPDPVVLQPVKGGYLIVCAWGDEASDEIVVNETMN